MSISNEALATDDMKDRDLPITDKRQDRLGMRDYCGGVASFIRACDTPMTPAIQGDWGTGKTTLMKLIEQECVAATAPVPRPPAPASFPCGWTPGSTR